MRRDVWAADDFVFRTQGKDLKRFINLAAQQKIRLAHLHWEKDGFTAQAWGIDHHKLATLAQQGGWNFCVIRRRGPGQWTERLLRRPGIPLGGLLFFLLLQCFNGLVWTIDFGNLEASEALRMRELLYESGIYEGAWLDSETLATAQTTALQQSDVFGWVSLNFTGGCLSIESTPAEYQMVREEAPMTPLYAKESAEIVAIETQSGFTAVEVGQTVEQGQLLVDVVRWGRDEKEVPQGAAGRILARVQKSYTAFQPYTLQTQCLNGRSKTQEILYLWGQQWEPSHEEESAEGGFAQSDWEPLQWGRLSLPGCVYRQTVWEQSPQNITYSTQQAQALARRSCRAQLYKEFPDAVIESEECQITQDTQGETCIITYQFCANIADSNP